MMKTVHLTSNSSTFSTLLDFQNDYFTHYYFTKITSKNCKLRRIKQFFRKYQVTFSSLVLVSGGDCLGRGLVYTPVSIPDTIDVIRDTH